MPLSMFTNHSPNFEVWILSSYEPSLWRVTSRSTFASELLGVFLNGISLTKQRVVATKHLVRELPSQSTLSIGTSFPGTKLHQSTRKAISKRKPALMNAIRKFNKYCETLERLYKPEWNIPLPEPLPTQLAVLRDGPILMEDVWVTPAEGEVPRWLQDRDVREGIRAVLKLDRCLEERHRLGIEADNLCRWFGRELCAIELALSVPSSKFVSV